MRNLLKMIFSNFKRMSSAAASVDSYVWIDLEMTGLNVVKDKILEIGCIITTTDLTYVDEGINIVIHQPEEVLKSMSDWCLIQHKKSGLIEKCSKSKISISEAEEQLSNYIKKYTNPQGVRYLAGNSVYMDKIFLEKYVPLVNNLLHYRILDVSSIKILSKHWYPDLILKTQQKNVKHRAFDDVKNSISELEEYRKTLFIK